jgi:hypothetical protein
MSQTELLDSYVSGRISRRRFIGGLTTLGMSAAAAALYATAIVRNAESVAAAQAFVGYRCVDQGGNRVTYVTTAAAAGAFVAQGTGYQCTEIFTDPDSAAVATTAPVVVPLAVQPSTTTTSVVSRPSTTSSTSTPPTTVNRPYTLGATGLPETK